MIELTDLDFYKKRRAKPGKGARKAELIKELWMQNNLITHHIIAGAASGLPQDGRGIAEANRLIVAAELMEITK